MISTRHVHHNGVRRTRSQVFSSLPFWATICIISALAIYSRVIARHGPIVRNVSEPRDLTTVAHLDQCRMVRHAEDKCAWITDHCAEEEAAFAAYLDLYYCRLSHVKPIAFVLLLLWISTLFNTIGIAASDFFCVNLSTIATALGMSESMAGVTLLAFGNGSPDVFSTFAAMSTNSSSLAIGELIGAAAFITAVVAASMALVRPFRVGKKTFVRDLLFFIVAAAFSMGFLIDGRLHLWECLFMVSYYLFYVVVVLIWHWYMVNRQARRHRDHLVGRSHFAFPSHDHLPDGHVSDDHRDTEVGRPQDDASDFADFDNETIRADDDHDDDDDDNADDDSVKGRLLSELNDNMHLSTPANRNRTNSVAIAPIRPSLVGALEFQAVLSNLQRSKSSQNFLMIPSPIADNSRLSPPIHHRNHSHGSLNDRPLYQNRSDTDTNLLSVNPPTTGRARARSTNDALRSTPAASSRTLDTSMLTDLVQDRRSSLEDQFPAKPSLLTVPTEDAVLSVETTRPNSPDAERPPSHRGSIGSRSCVTPVRSPLLGSMSPLHLRDIESMNEPTVEEPPSWWPRILPTPTDLADTLFPTLRLWSERSWISRAIGLVGIPSIFLLTITLPVVYPDAASSVPLQPMHDERRVTSRTALLQDTTEEPPAGTLPPPESPRPETPKALPLPRVWNRWLVIVQLFLSPLLLVLVAYTQYFTPDEHFWRSILRPCLVSLLISLVTLVLLLLTSSPNHRPTYYQPILSLVGFVISIAWISTIAAQVVAILKTFALILGMSHAIMGLTFFAVGNSLSDLVANVTVARLGYPVMALSACFGGPMLNILLGIGLSGSWILIRGAERRHAHHPDKEVHYKTYEIHVGRTLIVSGITLLVGLVGLLIVVPLNKWMMDRKIAWALIALWCVGTSINVGLDIFRGES